MENTPPKLELITKYFQDFTPRQLEQFAALEGLYQEWNQQINVISRKDIDSLYEKHVLHSLSIAAAFEFPAGTQIIDIGTGGGFPGIPLAIFFPEVQFHLVDSIAKKLKVVSAIAEKLELKNLTTQHTRAEEIKGRKFHYAVSRAVAPLKELWSWARPLLKNPPPNEQGVVAYPSGLICLKGGDLAQEIQDSGTRPRMMEIHGIFPEELFREKFIVYLQK